VVIHVVAEQASIDGAPQTLGAMIGSDALIPPELLAELARSATLRPLIHPADAPPENGLHAVAGVKPTSSLSRSDVPIPGLR